MKKTTLIVVLAMLCLFYAAESQLSSAHGKITDENGKALPGTTIRLKNTKKSSITGQNGGFTLRDIGEGNILVISRVGYQTIEIKYSKEKPIEIRLKEDNSELKEIVINTGYYQTPKERATGSFDYISNDLINRSTGSNIIARLEGITSSLHFDRRENSREAVNAPELRMRGLSTINSNEAPLIVVDNFPYEGDINNINPNDVESITILKDAAAASIWGARAGNGVIVITTKQSRFNQKTSITLNSNVTIGNKPDLYYNQRWLPSTTVMDFEKELFSKNTYAQQPETVLPAYVELLIKKKAGAISEADFNIQETRMKNTDSRKLML